jgi:hypothetical protein
MIFGFLKVAEKISHVEAFSRADLRSKHMGNKTPNGNIIVDANGSYNRFDLGIHKARFEKIKRHYVVADRSQSRMLTSGEIRRLAPNFLATLGAILGCRGDRAIDMISRKGRVLTAQQAALLLAWLNDAAART